MAMDDQASYEATIDGENYQFSDAQLTGRQIRAAAKLAPASEYVLILIEEGSSRSIGLDELIDISAFQRAEFKSFRSDRLFTFTVNERGFEWGADEISVADIRRIAEIADSEELVLDSRRDEALPNDGSVRLSKAGVERVRSHSITVHIFVNTRKKEVPRGNISFEELVELAFPNAPYGANTAYTVGYQRGGGQKPTGTLIAGETVQVVKGMRFNVTATDKS